MNEREQLRLLSILYAVGAGLTGLLVAWGLVVLSAMVAMTHDVGFDSQRPFQQVVLVSSIPLLLLVWLAASMAIVSSCVARRRHYTLCLVIAGFTCVLFPLGTALGVFTFVVLTRDSVRELFHDPLARPRVA